jgi:protein-S-isoprenylcysteine O-methyltransferase Ste14
VQRRVSRASGWLLVVVVGGIAGGVVPDSAWRALTVHAPWLRTLGAAVLLAGTAFTLWARAALGTMWSSAVVAKQEHVLRADGPYGITRHPIYTGMVAMLAGSALLAGLGHWLFALVLGVAIVLVKLHLEERLLTEVFPGEYEEYRRRVPQLVPGLHWPPRSFQPPR